MIITKPIGGLGNQLFQYATGKVLALKHNTNLALDISEFDYYKVHAYSLSHFNITADDFHLSRIRKKICKSLLHNPYYPFMIYKEANCRFDAKVLLLPDQTYLDGYWQSEKYFSMIRATLLNELTLKSSLSTYSEEILKKINQKNSVSVHVRRGDYITNPEAAKIYVQCNESYYKIAYEKMKAELSDPHFFIFSDDINWAKTHLNFISPVTFIEDPNQKNYEDLHLMRSCKHNITANSTFSWWAAWCNININKLIITPKDWFLIKKLPESGVMLDEKDLLPEAWFKI